MQLLNLIRKQYPDELYDAKIAAYLTEDEEELNTRIDALIAERG